MKFKNSIFYLIVTGGAGFALYWILQAGKGLQSTTTISKVLPDITSSWTTFLDSLWSNYTHPLGILLAQIVTIILVARLFGWVCKRIGQPTVIGEIAAGIILGPTIVGRYLPEVSAHLFPTQFAGNLQILSQIGLIFFMFVVGMELDLKVLKNRARDAVLVSHASIVFPFVLGVGLAYYLYADFAPTGVVFSSFALFLGIAMSITAFPVLARIVQERGLSKTKLGALVITCAAADDITAWCMLAAVIAIVKAGSLASSLYTIALAAVYLALMVWVLRPFLKRVGELHTSNENLSKSVVAIFFLALLLSAFATEIIGIHALFGAFIAGIIMPDNLKFRTLFIEKVEDVSLVLLLPLFFVFTGLRTQIGLIDSVELWGLCGIIVLVAVIGKFFGSALAARFVGQSWKESLSIGALMNTRGLMELVVLNIGYDIGVLKDDIFAMMVIMALVTTCMTGPALTFINWAFRSIPDDANLKTEQYKILISFANPERGRTLLRLANSLIRKQKDRSEVTALHLTLSNELHHYNIDEYEKQAFTPVSEEGLVLDQQFNPQFKPSTDIDADIALAANEGKYDLLLVGVGQSIFEGSLLGKLLGFTTRIINPDLILNKVTGKEKLFENSPFDERMRFILARTEVPVGIVIDKELQKIEKILVPIYHVDDRLLLHYAEKLARNADAHITVFDPKGLAKSKREVKEALKHLEKDFPGQVTLLQAEAPGASLLYEQDLMLIALESWKRLLEQQSPWLNAAPSTLILRG
jgi:Kef-type K+ transport system membrane component KefB